MVLYNNNSFVLYLLCLVLGFVFIGNLLLVVYVGRLFKILLCNELFLIKFGNDCVLLLKFLKIKILF